MVLPYKLILKSRTVEMRRLGIKLRTYENAKVFLEGTAGRGRAHWATQDFAECMALPEEITYFSETSERPAIAIHGDHVHVFSRDSKGSLAALDSENAEMELVKFVEKLRVQGVQVELEKRR
ncbi:MAG: hypothetical protein ACP5KV_05130 [Candidatus Methanomethylicaceae archaeon]